MQRVQASPVQTLNYHCGPQGLPAVIISQSQNLMFLGNWQAGSTEYLRRLSNFHLETGSCYQ